MNSDAIVEFVKSQRSLHLYKNIQDAFVYVLKKFKPEDFENIKSNLIIMAFHEGVKGQVMHFPPRIDNFAVMQLYIPSEMPDDVLRHVIAHEFGHVLQGRNSEDSDGDSLENDANEFAKSLGFGRSIKISNWLGSHK